MLTLIRIIVFSVMVTAGATLFAIVDPFGADESTDIRSRDVVIRTAAPLYPVKGRWGGQADIAVVTLSETVYEALRDRGWSEWPPSYLNHTQILDELYLWDPSPRAIFIDFIYQSDLGEPGEFGTFIKSISAATKAEEWKENPACRKNPVAKIACIADAGGTPVLIAKTSPLESFTPGDVQAAIDAVAVLVPIAFQDTAGAYPLRLDYAPHEGRGLSVEEKARRGVAEFDLSPAAAMFLAWCARAEDRCGITDWTTAPAWMDEAVRIRWGSRAPDGYGDVYEAVYGADPDCTEEEKAPGTLARIFSAQLFTAQVGRNSVRQPCPYSYEVPYSAIELGQLDVATLHRTLGDKIVLLGGRLAASSDWWPSVVHGLLPGVHHHAMAADNLLVYGERFYRDPAPMFAKGPLAALDFDEAEIAEILAMLSMAFVCALARVHLNTIAQGRARRVGRETVPLWRMAGVYVLVTATLCLIAVAVLAYLTDVRRYAPINWLGLLSFALFFSWLQLRSPVESGAGSWLARQPLLRPVGALLRGIGSLFSLRGARYGGGRPEDEGVAS